MARVQALVLGSDPTTLRLSSSVIPVWRMGRMTLTYSQLLKHEGAKEESPLPMRAYWNKVLCAASQSWEASGAVQVWTTTLLPARYPQIECTEALPWHSRHAHSYMLGL